MPEPARERLRHYWVHHRWLDLMIPVSCLTAWTALARVGWLPLALTEVPADARRALYQVLATIAVTMSGVTLTSVSLLLSLLRTPMSAIDHHLPADDKRSIGAAFLAIMPWLTVLFAAALVGMATDANVTGGYWWLQLAVIGLASASACAIGRVTWILRRILTAAADVASTHDEPPAPPSAQSRRPPIEIEKP